MVKAEATQSSFIDGSSGGGESVLAASRTLYTAIPYGLRRNLCVARALLGCSGVLLYALQPVNLSLFLLPPLVIFTIWSVWLATQEQGWPTGHLLVQLLPDIGMFVASGLHPGDGGLWLAALSYFFLLLSAGLLYPWQTVIGLMMLAAAAFALFPVPRSLGTWPLLVLSGILPAVLSLQRRVLEERLFGALRRSVLSRSEAETAREDERQRMSADFHDGPLQSFISFQMRLEIIRKLMSRDAARAMKELVELQDLGRMQVTELRAFVRVMQPVEVSPATLGSAIREVVEHFERDSGITTELYCGDLSQLDESISMDVLQIVREALNNARKHSKASRVRMEIEVHPDAFEVRIDDDGSGFPFSGTYDLDELEILRLGPRSIKKRVRTLGGGLLLESRPTEGATLKIRIPVTK